MLRKDVIADLQRDEKNDPDGHIAAHIWCVDDVIGQAKEEYDREIDNEAANDILDELHRNIDSEYGLKWSDIDFCLEEYWIHADIK